MDAERKAELRAGLDPRYLGDVNLTEALDALDTVTRERDEASAEVAKTQAKYERLYEEEVGAALLTARADERRRVCESLRFYARNADSAHELASSSTLSWAADQIEKDHQRDMPCGEGGDG